MLESVTEVSKKMLFGLRRAGFLGTLGSGASVVKAGIPENHLEFLLGVRDRSWS